MHDPNDQDALFDEFVDSGKKLDVEVYLDEKDDIPYYRVEREERERGDHHYRIKFKMRSGVDGVIHDVSKIRGAPFSPDTADFGKRVVNARAMFKGVEELVFALVVRAGHDTCYAYGGEPVETPGCVEPLADQPPDPRPKVVIGA